MLSINAFPFLSRERVSLLFFTQHPDKIALTNGANNSEFAHFQTLTTFFRKVQKNLVNQQHSGKVSNFEQ